MLCPCWQNGWVEATKLPVEREVFVDSMRIHGAEWKQNVLTAYCAPWVQGKTTNC